MWWGLIKQLIHYFPNHQIQVTYRISCSYRWSNALELLQSCTKPLVYDRFNCSYMNLNHSKSSQITSFMGPTWGPSGTNRTQVGPMLAPWTLLSGLLFIEYGKYFQTAGVYTKFSGRLSEEPFPWLIQKFPCILIFKTGQPGCQLNLSEGQFRLDLTSGRSLV